MTPKSHDLWLVGKLRSNPFKWIQAYVSIFSLSRDIHQTLDKSKTCQCFWKSLYNPHDVSYHSVQHHQPLSLSCPLSISPTPLLLSPMQFLHHSMYNLHPPDYCTI